MAFFRLKYFIVADVLEGGGHCGGCGMMEDTHVDKVGHDEAYETSPPAADDLGRKLHPHEYPDVVRTENVSAETVLDVSASVMITIAIDTTVHSLLSSTKPDDIAQLDTLFKPCSPILKYSTRAVLEADLYYPFERLAQSNDYSSYELMAACADFTAEGKSPLEKAFGFGQNSAFAKGIISALSYFDVDKAFTEVFKQTYNISTAQTESYIATNREKDYGTLTTNLETSCSPLATSKDRQQALPPSDATILVNSKFKVVYIFGTIPLRGHERPVRVRHRVLGVGSYQD
ncbi:hypothetical protein DYB28_008403 [Aphanomyces astaci]|uniref:Uncharacterized protein n=1 Tax=Aphanomyces astaci TaxID=112090 RepID=A0A9X8DNB1_APHAT|nr:hypothetical protein DYB28_008403 [Aphanomyces astaci]